jgi:hypothetical protein
MRNHLLNDFLVNQHVILLAQPRNGPALPSEWPGKPDNIGCGGSSAGVLSKRLEAELALNSERKIFGIPFMKIAPKLVSPPSRGSDSLSPPWSLSSASCS